MAGPRVCANFLQDRLPAIPQQPLGELRTNPFRRIRRPVVGSPDNTFPIQRTHHCIKRENCRADRVSLDAGVCTYRNLASPFKASQQCTLG